jgi:hypothetical protein
MNNDFKEKFKQKENSKKFHSHLELDLFVQELMIIDPEFVEKYKHEYSLLKSFDRAFWLKFFKFPSVFFLFFF